MESSRTPAIGEHSAASVKIPRKLFAKRQDVSIYLCSSTDSCARWNPTGLNEVVISDERISNESLFVHGKFLAAIDWIETSEAWSRDLTEWILCWRKHRQQKHSHTEKFIHKRARSVAVMCAHTAINNNQHIDAAHFNLRLKNILWAQLKFNRASNKTTRLVSARRSNERENQ